MRSSTWDKGLVTDANLPVIYPPLHSVLFVKQSTWPAPTRVLPATYHGGSDKSLGTRMHILDVLNSILAEKRYQWSHCIWAYKMHFISCHFCQIFEHLSFLRLRTGIVHISSSSGKRKWNTRLDADSKAVQTAGYASTKLSYLIRLTELSRASSPVPKLSDSDP